MLGTWQGIFLFEHRHDTPERSIALHLIGEYLNRPGDNASGVTSATGHAVPAISDLATAAIAGDVCNPNPP